MGLFDRLFGKKKQKESAQTQLNQENKEDLNRENHASLTDSTEKTEHSKEKAKHTADSADTVKETQDSFSETEASSAKQELTEEGSSLKKEEQSQVSIEKDSAAISDETDPIGAVANKAAPQESNEHEKEHNSSDAFMQDYYVRKAELAQQAQSENSEKLSDDRNMLDENQGSSQLTETKEETVAEAAALSSDNAQKSESEEEKYNRSLKKTRSGFGARLNAFLANFRNVDEAFFEELEEMLILSDVGVQVASTLTEDLRYEAKLEKAKKPEALRRVIIEKLVDIYEKDGQFNEKINMQNDVTVMLFVGVNGVGKTTSIGKLAYKYKQQGKKVMLVAADTFRAGAVAQLLEWGQRVGVPVIKGPEKADPASVVYDGVEKAAAEGIDILMIDTAGRLQNKDNLMAELEKIGRIVKRVIPDAPHETLLALDASTGQNALIQAKEFSKITPLTGIVLTKIDGTAKGGVVLAIRQELDIPVKFIGFGEKIDDIGEFNSEDFMKGLLEGLI
ncbi:cell division protein [Streptococcus macacae NCTC 11558]|uniref:Signal recognition particle receptor FtsY n=1 Tax=Streptococcus macacae NCTC 11558 TaxID=764298 RepID=G5JYL4_9STRE|nr:signal recognition particle-docking protein FtsY [Streptococcus macacae]EHJ51961.1 signal recognition particle-docking protein FtsY [Streptococcus macacae NCTC 11558]SUN78127.1 cell division protein [Streptococcus macacae NCTC 11558]